MERKELNKTLRNMAAGIGACAPVVSEWKDEDDADTLLDRYIRTLDFAIDKDFPPLDFIVENFDIADLHKHNNFINEVVQLKDADHGIYVFLGSCSGSVRANGLKAVTLFIRHNSRIDVMAGDGARVQVRLCEKGSCTETMDGISRISVLKKK
jgi:hypothetical protein